jgi:hypothetical protein
VRAYFGTQVQLRNDITTLTAQQFTFVLALAAQENPACIKQEPGSKYAIQSFDVLKAHTLREMQSFVHWVKSNPNPNIGLANWPHIPYGIGALPASLGLFTLGLCSQVGRFLVIVADIFKCCVCFRTVVMPSGHENDYLCRNDFNLLPHSPCAMACVPNLFGGCKGDWSSSMEIFVFLLLVCMPKGF